VSGPGSQSNDVIVIDPATFKKLARFRMGGRPQHVVPSWDLKTLWVNDNDSNDLVSIDPATGRRGRRVPVAGPVNHEVHVRTEGIEGDGEAGLDRVGAASG
jgi:DNA-binding beta-propeller fold protein YncE